MSDDQNPPGHGDAQAREISMFAALARGDILPTATTTSSNNVSRRSDNESAPDNERPPTELLASTATDNNNRRDRRQRSRNRNNSLLPSEVAAIVDTLSADALPAAPPPPTTTIPSSASGTFHYTPSSVSKSAPAERANLEAAAQALGRTGGADDDLTRPAKEPTPPSPPMMRQPFAGAAETPVAGGGDAFTDDASTLNAPMFMEQVVMERPLFFGPILPPRVIQEGRRMVAPYADLPFNKMPPSVRNLIGAVKAFGFGLEHLLYIKDDDEFERYCQENPEYWRGDATVSVYSPLTDEVTRAERMQDIRERSRQTEDSAPFPIVRSATAPSRLGRQGLGHDPEASMADISSFWQASDQPQSLDERRSSSGPFSSSSSPVEATSAVNDQFTSWLRADGIGASASETALDQAVDMATDPIKESVEEPPRALTETELFAKWASGSGIGSVSFNANSVAGKAMNREAFDTFQARPVTQDDDDNYDDSDSVVDDELKKQVGLNEHLSKAIASLTDDAGIATMDYATDEQSRGFLNRDTENNYKKRPLSNYELTRGCAPLFGADDDPLPVEGDLGVHETREDQQRSNEQKRSQDIIEKFVGPNIFGCIACPNPASGPDDVHSWKSRNMPSSSQYLFSSTPSNSSSQASYSRASGQNSQGSQSDLLDRQQKQLGTKMYGATVRPGWWNADGSGLNDTSTGAASNSDVSASEAERPLLHLPPQHHAASSPLVSTLLEPTPQDLRDSNLPLSRLHAATPLAQCLPYISDRPPSYRFLQVETQAVGFPAVGGEVEPLFCSLAIYNVEAISEDGTPGSAVAPMPDLQRCGRVSEALHFDLVGDDDVFRRCHAALWPYSAPEDASADKQDCCRCGVFPIPSNLNISNLYVVLIVKKVFCDEAELDLYLKPNDKSIDIERSRSRAEYSANRFGRFLVPFAFGVAPLHQVFGTKDPAMVTSRAVQIPLFEFHGGERAIIDHIMVMLYPNADHDVKGSRAAANGTNGGTAMLIMRNFGFLGLHSVVDTKSSLARDRLIDFTGEMQLRMKSSGELDLGGPGMETENTGADTAEICKSVRPSWQKNFVSEPAIDGGRNVDARAAFKSRSPIYARELAAIPLQLTPSSRLSIPSSYPVGPRSQLPRKDIEPVPHTTFCNELLFQPRLVHNCSLANLIVMAELCELEWNEEYRTHVAYKTRDGPRIHNSRRGPFLVRTAFSSCSVDKDDHSFLDEFKLKLPLDLNPIGGDAAPRRLALLFTILCIRTDAAVRDEDTMSPGSSSQIACGFLPLASESCLLDDGLHDVRMIYIARDRKDKLREDDFDDTQPIMLFNREQDSGPGGMSIGSSLSQEEKRTMVAAEPISLSVRIVAHTSVHPQSGSLSSMLKLESSSPNETSGVVVASETDKGQGLLSSARGTHEDKLCELCIDVTKQSLCTIPQSSRHFWRLLSTLWRVVIQGSGEEDLAWANPSTSTELRVHGFASIMHLLGSTTMYFSRSGLSKIDGTSGWSVVTLSRIAALLFNEEQLFGARQVEVLDAATWQPKIDQKQTIGKHSSPPTEKRRRRGHVRQTYDLSNDVRRRDTSCSVDFSTLTGSMFSSNIAGFESPKNQTTHDNGSWRPEESAQKGKPKQIHRSKTSHDGASSQWEPPAISAAPLHVDTKSDFQSQLRAAMSIDQDVDGFDDLASRSLVRVGTSSGSRRWMTMPTRSLSTIREAEAGVDEGFTPDDAIGKLSEDSVDGNKRRDVQLPKPSVMQMRVPSLGRKKITTRTNTPTSRATPSVPLSEKDIMNAGSAFLDTISESFCETNSSNSEFAGEERRVGFTNHRSGHNNRTSIDWSIASALPSESVQESEEVDVTCCSVTSSLRDEEAASVRLPSFAERLSMNNQQESAEARWWPYAYEVIICQWAAILFTQRLSADKSVRQYDSPLPASGVEVGYPPTDNGALQKAADRCSGVSIASAPMLFEVIKQSLGYRLLSLYRRAQAGLAGHRMHPPLVVFDETLLTSLEHTISMVTDACLDARNFDSWELRQMSIDVNDSIIRFLCDLFSYMAPVPVHRLILVYLSRFVTSDGKQWNERDSMIGLRPSWEITKLRLNAITALVRFPDFFRVNGASLEICNAKSLTTSGTFDAMLKQYDLARIPGLIGTEDTGRSSHIEIPRTMNLHWLSEIVMDICLIGVGHAEQQIQHRSSSLLYELFWMSSQHAFLFGKCDAAGAMFLTFLEKLLPNLPYLSSFGQLSQMRADLIPCAIFVLQSAPTGLLRALWRRLCARLPYKARNDMFGISYDVHPDADYVEHLDDDNHCSILDLFSLLNLSLTTVEYLGHEDNLDLDSTDNRDSIEHWRRDFLLSAPWESSSGNCTKGKLMHDTTAWNTAISRRWMSHDAAVVVLDTAHTVVLEMYGILNSSSEGRSFLNPAARHQTLENEENQVYETTLEGSRKLDYVAVLAFVRGVTSVYLQSLALEESDVVIVKTFRVTAETIKVFGIRLFLEAIGETLQHWMRVLSFQCGARRAQVRVEATDLLELILRTSWECYGSFFRIRVPLLAVQTEVMERIVAIAAARFYRTQRKQGVTYETFSNLNAEASLVPLWRTLDRIEKQPASQNIAFRGALVRIASKLKRLYRAYVAARVLSFIQGSRESDSGIEATKDRKTESALRAQRISVIRVINASENYSRQFLGMQGTSQRRNNLAHYEAVEDAMINAADVFSSTELPEHRVAWLRMLADFHASRKKFAEEATCHFQIHTTLQHAARLHGSLWSNSPFLPWTDNMPDPVYIDGDRESPNADTGSDLEYGANDYNFGRQSENASSFRRIFYRVANSIATGIGEWDAGVSRNPFFGTTSASEYSTISPWITLREMEENMVEEAEAAGELFLQAGIIQSSRYSWNLAAHYYAERSNYTKLALTYSNLAATVVTGVPPLDTKIPQEISAALGRFYRVWFHGGAPDELSGVEFIYRTEANVRLDKFGGHLRNEIKSIIPDRTPIHLLLDDRVEERVDDSNSVNVGFSRIGAAPLEPVRIKVTPLRPLTEAIGSGTRGRPEWFRGYCGESLPGGSYRLASDLMSANTRASVKRSASNIDRGDPQHRDHARSFSATGFSSGTNCQATSQARHRLLYIGDSDSAVRSDRELSGVDKFCFIQSKDRKSSKEWWRTSCGDTTEKSLKVTQIQVAQPFPACVTRQVVVHRLVYSQSPLEAGVDAICQWCAVLFRTAVATSGQAILQQNGEPGIGTDAAKVVADCIHSSNVKPICIALLKKTSEVSDENSSNEFSHEYDRLTDEEITRLRLTVSRLAVVFVELLHLLIARNRDQLLDVIQTRKRSDGDSQFPIASHGGRSSGRSLSNGRISQDQRKEPRDSSPSSERSRNQSRIPTAGGSFDGRSMQNSFPSTTPEPRVRLPLASDKSTSRSTDFHKRGSSLGESSASAKTDSAIAVQSELQRAFIALCKVIHPRISEVLQDETPRWLRNCTLDNYFSLGTYRQTRVPIADELSFNANERMQSHDAGYVLGPPEDVETASPHDSVAGSSNSVLSRGSYGRDSYVFGAL